MTTRAATDVASFLTAVSNSVAGDTITLAPGTYSSLNINGDSFSDYVTVIALDPDNRPLINEITGQSSATGFFRFENLDISNPAIGGGAPVCFIENGSHDIWFENCHWIGVPNASGARRALAIRMNGNPTDITYSNCLFTDWKNGITSNQATRLEIIGCEFYGFGSDGYTLNRQTDFLFEGNYVHDNNRSFGGEHSDLGQIARSGGFGSNGIIIRNNVLDHADGSYGQGFFGGTSLQTQDATTEHYNITFENNLCYIAHTNALGLTWCTNVICRKNTVIFADAGVPYPFANRSTINFVGSTNVLIEDNIACAYAQSNGGQYTLTNNVTIPSENSFNTEFNIIAKPNAPYATGDSYNDFELASGTAAHTQLAGSRLMKREGGWPGTAGNIGIEPHPAYPGGFRDNVTNPTLSLTVSDPADNSAAVPVNKELTYTFSKAIQFGTGNITLRDNDGGFANLEVFDVTTDVGTGAGTISIAGNVLKVRPTSAMAYSREHALQIDATAIDDTETSPNSFAGVTDDTTLSFTTDAAPVSTPSGKRHLGSTFLGIGPFLS